MPWGITYSGGIGNGFSGQRQAGPRVPQNANPYAAPLFGSNRNQQAGSFRTRQNGMFMQQQTAQTRQSQQPAQLPDGVQVQPITAANMNMLQGMNFKQPVQQAGQASEPVRREEAAPPAPVQQEEAALPGPTDDILENSLRELIQDEYNSSRFYTYMATKAAQPVYADYFNRESNNCGERMKKLNEFYVKHGENAFSPLDTELNTRVDFHTGVSWAVAVESGALKKFGSLYENAPDDRSARMIFNHVCGKISHIMMLILIMQNKEIN